MSTETHDLGHGWFANFNRANGSETLTLRNCDKGQRIDLDQNSLATLRAIFARRIIKEGTTAP